jgi:hypothetical protein
LASLSSRAEKPGSTETTLSISAAEVEMSEARSMTLATTCGRTLISGAESIASRMRSALWAYRAFSTLSVSSLAVW